MINEKFPCNIGYHPIARGTNLFRYWIARGTFLGTATYIIFTFMQRCQIKVLRDVQYPK